MGEPPAETSAAVEPPAPANPEGFLAAGATVRVALAESLSSKTSKRGDYFGIKLVGPLVSEAGVLVPAGVAGRGQVVSAARAGRGGQAGELVLAARYIEYEGSQIPLRGLNLAAVGADLTKKMNFCKAVFTACYRLSDGEVQIAIGTQADAKLAADITMPVISPPPPLEPSSPSQSEAQ